MSSPDHRAEALEVARSVLEKQFGRGTTMSLVESTAKPVAVISTGSPALDNALGIGGFPRGRVAELFGPENSGKTTIALHLIAEAQRAGGTVAFIDADQTLDIAYAQRIGVDLTTLIVAQPDSGEQALEIVETLVRSGAVDLVVVDSVASLIPRSDLEGQAGDMHVGLQARIMSQALRKITAIADKTEAVVLFVNQLRRKIGATFGNGEITTGGNALKFYSSVRVEVRRIESDVVRFKVVKNKLAPPFRVADELIGPTGLGKVPPQNVL